MAHDGVPYLVLKAAAAASFCEAVATCYSARGTSVTSPPTILHDHGAFLDDLPAGGSALLGPLGQLLRKIQQADAVPLQHPLRSVLPKLDPEHFLAFVVLQEGNAPAPSATAVHPHVDESVVTVNIKIHSTGSGGGELRLDGHGGATATVILAHMGDVCLHSGAIVHSAAPMPAGASRLNLIVYWYPPHHATEPLPGRRVSDSQDDGTPFASRYRKYLGLKHATAAEVAYQLTIPTLPLRWRNLSAVAAGGHAWALSPVQAVSNSAEDPNAPTRWLAHWHVVDVVVTFLDARSMCRLQLTCRRLLFQLKHDTTEKFIDADRCFIMSNYRRRDDDDAVSHDTSLHAMLLSVGPFADLTANEWLARSACDGGLHPDAGGEGSMVSWGPLFQQSALNALRPRVVSIVPQGRMPSQLPVWACNRDRHSQQWIECRDQETQGVLLPQSECDRVTAEAMEMLRRNMEHGGRLGALYALCDAGDVTSAVMSPLLEAIADANMAFDVITVPIASDVHWLQRRGAVFATCNAAVTLAAAWEHSNLVMCMSQSGLHRHRTSIQPSGRPLFDVGFDQALNAELAAVLLDAALLPQGTPRTNGESLCEALSNGWRGLNLATMYASGFSTRLPFQGPSRPDRLTAASMLMTNGDALIDGANPDRRAWTSLIGRPMQPSDLFFRQHWAVLGEVSPANVMTLCGRLACSRNRGQIIMGNRFAMSHRLTAPRPAGHYYAEHGAVVVCATGMPAVDWVTSEIAAPCGAVLRRQAYGTTANSRVQEAVACLSLHTQELTEYFQGGNEDDDEGESL